MDDDSRRLLDDLDLGDEIVVLQRLDKNVYQFARGRYSGIEGRHILVDNDSSHYSVSLASVVFIRRKKQKSSKE